MWFGERRKRLIIKGLDQCKRLFCFQGAILVVLSNFDIAITSLSLSPPPVSFSLSVRVIITTNADDGVLKTIHTSINQSVNE